MEEPAVDPTRSFPPAPPAPPPLPPPAFPFPASLEPPLSFPFPAPPQFYQTPTLPPRPPLPLPRTSPQLPPRPPVALPLPPLCPDLSASRCVTASFPSIGGTGDWTSRSNAVTAFGAYSAGCNISFPTEESRYSFSFMQGGNSHGGSMQNLLRNAQAGVLNCNISEESDDLFRVSGDHHFGNQSTQLDEGYLGGEESDRGDCFGDISDSEPDENVVEEAEPVGDGPPAADQDAYRDDCLKDEKIPSTVLGDCGCVTCHNEEGDIDDEDDTDDEETVEVDLRQEIYVDQAQVGVPYKKRKRFPKNVKRPNCRAPRMMSAIEKALRSSSTRTTEHIFEPVVGMVFDSRDEAKEFYNLYSWEVGFGVKFNNSRSSGKKKGEAGKKDGEEEEDDDEPYRSMQDIVCQKSGSDPRIIGRTKRCGCPAKIHLLRTDDYGWYISSFVKEHNHEMSVTCGQKREWNSHRLIDKYTKETIKYLRENNVSLTKIHCILGSMFGSNGDVPWTKKSLRTVCNQITRDQMDDDIHKTMEIFKKMREEDPDFQFSVELGKKSRIKSLMWCSGRSRDQYACFGDVVTFDTTYCTNIYKMPFGLFVGVNNHFQTTIFAGVLMRRETTKSFMWVFKEFLKLMGGKAPKTILTDQCKAMTRAVAFIMPDTYHLWCKWHVMKRIRECLGARYTKDKDFRDDFWLVVNGMLTKDEFERGWKYLIDTYGLENSGFMKRTYECKEKWAKPWAKDHFCARMSSTQRSESANFMLKRFVPRNSSMNHFVSQYNRLLYDRDRQEDIEEDKTKQLKIIYERLWAIERHASSIYTSASFGLFRKEADKASNYIVTARDDNVFTVSHDNPAKRKKWSRINFKVEVLENGARFVCECGMYEHFGMLCCHALRLMLKFDIAFIPEAHIMKRWTRDARDILPEHLKKFQKNDSIKHSFTFRRRMLHLNNIQMTEFGDMDMELFDIVYNHQKAALKECKALITAREKAVGTSTGSPQVEDSDDDEEYEIGVQSDGEALRGNKYGASGSSAGLSDSEIMKLKAPLVVRKVGRPRSKRYKGSTDAFKKRKPSMRLKEGPKNVERQVNFHTSLEILTTSGNVGNGNQHLPVWLDPTVQQHSSIPRNEVAVAGNQIKKTSATKTSATKRKAANKGNVNTGIPKQTSCCRTCKLPGHNSSQCGLSGVSLLEVAEKRKDRVTKCGECNLIGHTASQCYKIEVSPATTAAYQ